MPRALFPSSESLLDNNRRRQIDNPLIHCSLSRLDSLAREFAQKVNPTAPDERLFVIAARIAYDPPGLETVDCTPHEKKAVLRERSLPFWKQPKPLQATVVTLCFSAIIQGWVQSVLNGANITLPLDLGLTDQFGGWKAPSSSNLWIYSGLNAITYLTAGLCGCWISDPLQSMYLGRRGAIFAAACLCFASVIGCAFTHTWQELMICRALLGLGLGAKASVTPIFCAEVAPNHLRGALVMNWQLMDTVGIFLGYSVNLILFYTDFYTWRLQIASACIPAACLLTLIWTVPESPRWLLKQNNFPAAFSSMCALRRSQLQAAIELLYANEQIQTEALLLPPKSAEVEEGTFEHREDVRHESRLDGFQESAAKLNYWARIWQLFRNRRTRRATVASAIVMLGQQFCGMNLLAFYGTTLFQNINGPTSNQSKALWMSWGIGLSNFVFTLPAYYRIDTRGRRSLLLTSYPGMTLCMLATCLSFLRNDEPVRQGLVVTFLFLFVLFYSFGQGPVAFAYASEVFPLLNREAGMSFAVFVNLFGAGILTLLVPQAQANQGAPITHPESSWQLTQIHLLAAFTVLNLASFVLIFLFVPETAGAAVRKTEGQLNYMYLEELNYIFGVPTWVHIKYQFQHVLPTAWQMVMYQVGRPFGTVRERPRFEKMYIWAQHRQQDDPHELEDSATVDESNDVQRNRSMENTATEPQPEQERQGLQRRRSQARSEQSNEGQAYVLDELHLERHDSWPLEFRD